MFTEHFYEFLLWTNVYPLDNSELISETRIVLSLLVFELCDLKFLGWKTKEKVYALQYPEY